MAKRLEGSSKQKEMELIEFRNRLTKQDDMLKLQDNKQDGILRTLTEILTILGGSSSMGVTGLRQDVKDLKADVIKLKEGQSMYGKFLISANSIPGFIVTLIVIIGGILGIVTTIKNWDRTEPKTEIREGARTPLKEAR